MKEKELSLGKEEIIEKIKNGKTPWNEYLPNLSLETIKDGHFYNLELIKKNQDVEIILGKEQIININEELLLPKDEKIIKFPLYSQDSNNKKLYLQIKTHDIRKNIKGFYYSIRKYKKINIRTGRLMLRQSIAHWITPFI